MPDFDDPEPGGAPYELNLGLICCSHPALALCLLITLETSGSLQDNQRPET